MFKYYEFTMFDNKPILDQVHELLVLVSKLRELKIVIPDPMIVGAIMAKLPQTWNNYRKKLLHMVEDISLEDLQKCIQIEEETRNRDKNFANQDFSKVHIVEGNKYKKNFKVKIDKGKFKKTNSNNNQKNANGVCYHCGKKGHYIRDCRHRKASEEYANKTNSANMVENSGIDNIVAMVSMMHIGMITELNMAAVIKSSDWWLDSGATIHVCNDKAQFKTYEASTDNQEVLMGNHNSAKVLGKGTVELQFTSGKKLTMLNVLHVPEIRKNLVSANLLCKNGIKTVLESDKLIMSKNWMFAGKGYSCNGMFKLSINNKVNSSAYIIESSSHLWHLRLAHINFRSLKYMRTLGLIACNDDYNDKCETCIQAKMTKKPFSNNRKKYKFIRLNTF